MIKVEVMKPFEDLSEGIAREVGDTFSCEKERAEYLVSLALVKAIGEDKPKPARKPKKKVED